MKIEYSEPLLKAANAVMLAAKNTPELGVGKYVVDVEHLLRLQSVCLAIAKDERVGAVTRDDSEQHADAVAARAARVVAKQVEQAAFDLTVMMRAIWGEMLGTLFAAWMIERLAEINRSNK